MISYKLKLNSVLYSEIDELYRYVQRASVPGYLGRAYGSIYTKFIDIPDSGEYMNAELDEISEFYVADMNKVQEHFQKLIFGILKIKPPSHKDIYFSSYTSAMTDIYSQIQIDVDYHDESSKIIYLDESNVDDYFKLTHVFKQDKSKGYSESEVDTYSFLDDDYYHLKNPFPSVEKYNFDKANGSCRNFTFQVTEDCNLRCFAAGTKVLMANYTEKNIEDVAVGDIVLGFNECSDGNIDLVPSTVYHTFSREARTVKLTTPIGDTYVTPTHEYITADGTWVDIKDLDNSKNEIIFVDIEYDEKDERFEIQNLSDYVIDKKHLFHDPVRVYNIETSTSTYIANNVCCHNCSYCAPAGTKVLLPDGSKVNIEDVVPGMYVVGFTEDRKFNFMNKLYATPVLNNFSRNAKVVEIIFANKTIDPLVVTPEHPFFTANRGWVPAINLRLNDRLVKITGTMDNPLYICPIVDHVHVTDDIVPVYNLTTVSHTFIMNDYLVHNCYQTNKCASIMDLDTAKSAIDDLLAGNFEYLSPGFSKSIILEFIGGDPLLEIDLIGEIYEYFLQEAYRLNHPWFHHHRMSMCSNGMLYFNYATKRFFDKYAKQTSFNISIDGNKALHDACRIQPTGEGSYDIGIAGVHHSNKVYRIEISSKMTLAPSNIPMIMDSIKNLCIDNNYPGVNLNVVFEDVWNQHDARVLYDQLIGVADMVFEHNRPDLYFSIFRSSPLLKERDISDDLQNVCFRAGTQVLTTEGNKNIEDIKVGDFVYSASGTIMHVVKTSSHWSTDNVRVQATGIFPIECTQDHKFFAMPFDYLGWKGVKHWKKKDFYPIGELKAIDKKNGIKVGDKIALPIMDFSKNTEHIDSKLAYALGIFVADGCLSKNSVIITPGYDKDGYYQDKLNEAGLSFSVGSQATTMRYIISPTVSVTNQKFVEMCSKCGHLAHNKHVPELIFRSDESTVLAFLHGYLDTDGSLDERPGSKNYMKRRMNTVSPHLANDITYLLRSFGYYPTVYHNKREGTAFIVDHEAHQRDRYEIYYFEDGRQNGSFIKDDEYPVVWTSIQKMEPVEPFMVYNMTVEGPPTAIDPTGEHTIVTNGVGVSQCGGAGSMLSLNPTGTYYPCIRYMPSSLNGEATPLVLGDIKDKMIKNNRMLREFTMVTQMSQQNDRCLSCPLVRMCSWCMRAGTLILTPTGLTPIEDIKVGDMVISHDSKPHRVERVLKRKSNDNVAIKAFGAPFLFTTNSHKFYAKRKLVSDKVAYADGYDEIAVGDLHVGDRICLFKFNNRKNIHFNTDIAYLVGRWIGDGTVECCFQNNVETESYAIICLTNEIPDIETRLKRCNIEYSRTPMNTIRHRFTIAGSNDLTQMIAKCGKYEKDRIIPPEMFDWDDDAIKNVLQGIYDSANAFCVEADRIWIDASTKKMAIGIQLLERCIGIISDDRDIRGENDPDGSTYLVRLKNNEDVNKYCDDGTFCWGNVLRMYDPGEYDVYNLTVEDTHDYVADGVLVRNCSGLCYQNNGTVNERTTHICEMIKAEYLASIYYWGNMAKKYPQYEIMLDEEMVPYYHFENIISREEYDRLNSLIIGDNH